MLVVLKIFYFLTLIFILKASIPLNQPFSLFIKDGRKFSSPQPQLQPPDNRTIQNFVETYVDSYIGGYAVARRKDLFTDTAAILNSTVFKKLFWDAQGANYYIFTSLLSIP